MVNYLHQFPPNLSTVRSHLTELAESTVTWNWTHFHRKSLQEVNNTLAADAAVRPRNYNSTEAIYLVIDASSIGTGVWVGQDANRNEIRPVLFHSVKFKPVHENYTTFNKELWAIVNASEHFGSMLTGCNVAIVRDPKLPEADTKQYGFIGKEARWQQIINQFDCTIEYQKGDKNVIPDTFSRVF